MAPELVNAILTKVRETWVTSNDVEVTMEANPGSVEAGRFHAYRNAGVNRISIGVQALNDTDLKALGRLHSAKEARSAIALAQQTFDRVSFDLIYARQQQSLAAWQSELSEALAMASGHLSLYQLTIEDGTAFGDRFRRGLLRGLPNEDLGADMYLVTQDVTEAAGYQSYEISNYAQPGKESRHNCIYWNAGDYVGIGPGAHGRLTLGGTRLATEALANPISWLETVESTGAAESREAVSQREQGIEYLIMGLRRDVGIDLERLAFLTQMPLPLAKISELCELGMVTATKNRLTATRQGRLVLNAVIEALVD